MRLSRIKRELPSLIISAFLLAVVVAGAIYALREGEIDRRIRSWPAEEGMSAISSVRATPHLESSLAILELEGETEWCYLVVLQKGKLYVLGIPTHLVIQGSEGEMTLSQLRKSGLGGLWSFFSQVLKLPVSHCLILRGDKLAHLVDRTGRIFLNVSSPSYSQDMGDGLQRRLEELGESENNPLRAGLIFLTFGALWSKIFNSRHLLIDYQLERMLADAMLVDGSLNYRKLRDWGEEMEGLKEDDIVILPCPKTFSGEEDELDGETLHGLISSLLGGENIGGMIETIQQTNKKVEEERRDWEMRKRLTFDPVPVEVIYRAMTGRMEVAITLDDGYNLDPRILDLLERHHIKSTVFLVGGWARSNPDWVKRMDSAGFEVCNHTLRHPWLTKLPDDQIRYELVEAERIIFDITGKNVHYFRPPGGYYDARVAAVVASLGYKMVMWSIDSADTRYRSVPPETRAANILARVKPGDILLFHFGGYYTYETLSLLIPQLEAQGYRMVTLTELLKP